MYKLHRGPDEKCGPEVWSLVLFISLGVWRRSRCVGSWRGGGIFSRICGVSCGTSVRGRGRLGVCLHGLRLRFYINAIHSQFQIKAGEIIHAPAAAGSAGAGVASELEVSSAAGEAAAAGSLSAAGAASALLVSAAAAGAASVASSLDPFVSRAVILDCSED